MTHSTPRTLSDVCEPLFMAICRMNRLARPRDGAAAAPAVKLHPSTARAQLIAAFREMDERAAESHLDAAYDQNLQIALKCFADLMMVRGGYEFSEGWDFLSKNDCAAPGQYYIEQIKLTLDDGSEEAAERLNVYHTCLCFGCEGHFYPEAQSSPEFQELFRNVAQRVEARTRAPAARQICRDAYDGVFRERPPRPVQESLRPILAVAVALIAVSVLLAYAAHNYFVSDLNRDLKTVLSTDGWQGAGENGGAR